MQQPPSDAAIKEFLAQEAELMRWEEALAAREDEAQISEQDLV
jgi:hypothetical protein